MRKTKPKWKTVRVKQELLAAIESTIETRHYESLSEFVSEAVRLQLDTLEKHREETVEKQAEYQVIQDRMLYTPSHMWATVTPEGNTRVGLSEYAQERLKGIAAIQTYPVGHKVEKGEPFGVVETWMFMFDLCSPVSGRIVEVNRVLLDDPLVINKNPQKITWIAEIEPNSLVALEEELRGLMKTAQYKMWVRRTGRPRILSI